MSEPAAAYFARILSPLVETARAAALRVIATGSDAAEPDADAVHDMRVAMRRLRTLLRPARRAFGKKKLRPIEEGLRAHAHASSALRDEEALRETLAGLSLDPATRAAVDAWLARRARDEREMRADVIHVLEGEAAQEAPPLAACLDRLARRLTRPRKKQHGAVALARRALAEALAGVQELAHGDPTDSDEMHALRIRFKRLRYTAEAFAPLIGDGALVVAGTAARMQKRLGNLHDVDDAIARARRARELEPAARASLLEALGAERARLSARAQADLARELPALEGACGALSGAPLGDPASS